MKWEAKGISAILLALILGMSMGALFQGDRADAAESKLLQGEEWAKMSLESKRAFILGVGEMADIEEEMIGKYPELKRDSFSEKVAEALGDVPLDTVVNRIDAFYKANPAKMNVPVMRVVWDEMIKPKVSTIAGKPIKK